MADHFPSRPCPVCCAVEPQKLFRQQFSAWSEGGLYDGYDLVHCQRCGAGYADDIPEQAAFDRYYAAMSKYENDAGGGEPSATEKQRYGMVAEVLERAVKKDVAVLDVGCATGGLLAELARRGFVALSGIDPSARCVDIVRRRLGLTAEVGTFTTMPTVQPRPEVVLLIGVMEHLRDVDAALETVKHLLPEGRGEIYIEVPDASRYDEQPSAPYQLISYEHVNYFSRESLGRLMARHGFVESLFEACERPLSPAAAEPAVAVLYRRNEAASVPGEPKRDDDTAAALQRYLARSAREEGRVRAIIGGLVDAQRPLAVWGTGTHTLRLLETTRLREAKIVAFLDSNARYQGKQLAGRPVVAPTAFEPEGMEILISSQVAEAEIYQEITHRLRWSVPVHTLYGAAGPAPG